MFTGTSAHASITENSSRSLVYFLSYYPTSSSKKVRSLGDHDKIQKH